MGLSSVYLGQNFQVSAEFRDDANIAVAGTLPASYKIFTHNSQLVVSGSAAQSGTNPALWSANVVIPSSAPVAAGNDKYTIEWRLVATNGSVYKTTDSFSVLSPVDFDDLENDRILLEGGELNDAMKLPAYIVPTSLHVSVIREDNTIVYASSELIGSADLTTTQVQDEKIYQFDTLETSSLLTVGDTGISPYIIKWSYTVNGRTSDEFHFVFVINARTLNIINQLRRTIDKARSEHPNPVLRYTDVDLVAYIMQGLSLINGLKPNITNWDFNTLPAALHLGLVQAAAYCALSAQYLAEGQAAFDFSGQAISLNVDRTQYIDAALGRIMDFINDKIPATKKMLLRSSSMGILGVNVGPSLGVVAYGVPYDRLRRRLAGFL